MIGGSRSDIRADVSQSGAGTAGGTPQKRTPCSHGYARSSDEPRKERPAIRGGRQEMVDLPAHISQNAKNPPWR